MLTPPPLLLGIHLSQRWRVGSHARGDCSTLGQRAPLPARGLRCGEISCALSGLLRSDMQKLRARLHIPSICPLLDLSNKVVGCNDTFSSIILVSKHGGLALAFDRISERGVTKLAVLIEHKFRPGAFQAFRR